MKIDTNLLPRDGVSWLKANTRMKKPEKRIIEKIRVVLYSTLIRNARKEKTIKADVIQPNSTKNRGSDSKIPIARLEKDKIIPPRIDNSNKAVITPIFMSGVIPAIALINFDSLRIDFLNLILRIS
ncbi:MAG: hypothetical protein U1V55_23565 [Planktothrix rubescens PR222]